MIKNSIKKLNHLIDNVAKKINEISDEELSTKPFPNKWSKKEIIGHLIDSAVNNHSRIIRAQYEDTPEITYDQNNWNKLNFYQSIKSNQLISFWKMYNKHLLQIINRIPVESLMNKIKVGNQILTLEFIIVDYVEHLEYHLNQIIEDK